MKKLLVPVFALALSVPLVAQPGYRPSASNLAAREWFQDARFGMFIHWGVYSVLADGEWVMNNRKIPVADYEKLPGFFNPISFDAAEWVSLAKSAGMKYITITSKHHDGFAMFDSKVSDYNIVARTPYKKDPMKALAEECRRQGLKLFFYYSQLDWHNPDYFPRGRTGQDSGRPEQGSWPRYLDYMNAQLRELLTNYGDVAGIWFDGWWDKPDADWQLPRTYSLIHELQPQALIGSNHHKRPNPAGVRHPPARDGRVDVEERRVDLRNARRTDPATPLGCDDEEGESRLRARARRNRRVAAASAASFPGAFSKAVEWRASRRLQVRRLRRRPDAAQGTRSDRHDYRAGASGVLRGVGRVTPRGKRIDSPPSRREDCLLDGDLPRHAEAVVKRADERIRPGARERDPKPRRARRRSRGKGYLLRRGDDEP